MPLLYTKIRTLSRVCNKRDFYAILRVKMASNKQDKTAKLAYKTFRYVLDRIYDPKIQNRVIRLGGGYPVPGLLPLPKSFTENLTHYYSTGGQKERPGYDSEGGNILVRQAIARYENRKHKTNYTPENVALVAGATYGTNRILEILFRNNSEKEVLAVAPTFYKGLYRAFSLCKFRSIVIPANQNFVPTANNILSQVSKKTRVVFFCNPGNPSGKYIPQSEIKKIAENLNRLGVFLIIDEVQDAFSFLKKDYRYGNWIRSANIIRIRSVSKLFTLAEFRLGYVIADKKIIGDNHRGLIELVGYDIGNPPPVLNYFFINTLADYPKQWDKIMARRKNLAMKLLKQIPAVKKVLEPDACFNLTFKFSSWKFKTDLSLFNALIDKKVAMMPVSGFGYDTKECWMRLTFASPDHMIKKGVEVLSRLLKR